MQLEDIRHKWDRDGNGKLDFNEFAWRLQELGFEAAGGEMHEIFKILDTDHSGSLAAGELPRAFKALVDESIQRELLEPRLAAAAAEARKTAEKSQLKALRKAHAALDSIGAGHE